jgi:hypothetical protein
LREDFVALETSRKDFRFLWAAITVVVIVGGGLFFGPTRRLAEKFFDSLGVERVQTVNVNLSSFVGPDANHSLQQMVSQMISDQVKVTVNEKSQPAANATTASHLAGFQIQLFSGGTVKTAPGGKQ